jgi:hypothetical protein
VFRQAAQGGDVRFLTLLGVGMHADAGIQIGEALDQRQHAGKAFQRHAGDQRPADVLRFHCRQIAFFLTLKIGKIQMAMRVDEQFGSHETFGVLGRKARK